MLTHPYDTIIGNIPDDWEQKPLRLLLKAQSSGDWGADEGEQPITVIRSTNFTDSGVLDLGNVAIRYFAADKAEKFSLCKGDVLVERSGGGPDQPVGRVAFVPYDMDRTTVSNFVQILRPDPEKVNSEYLGWVLYELQRTGMTERVQQQSTQMRNLQWRDYQRLLLPKPEIHEQQRIAAALKFADNAIVEAQAELAATQEFRRSLTSELLTKNSTSWEACRILDMLREPIRNGYSPVCPQDPTGRWVLSLEALNDDGYNPKGIKPAPDGDEKLLPFRLVLDDILVSRSNTAELVGRVGKYDGDPEIAFYPDLMMRVRVDEKRVSPQFAELLLRSDLARRWLRSRASGTSGSMVKIKRRDITSMPILLPLPHLQREIVNQVNIATDAVQSIERKLAALGEARKSLLQSFLTGQVRIPEGVIDG